MDKTVERKVMLICVSGGTGSGKTTIAQQILESVPKTTKAALILQDNYYLNNDEFEKDNIVKNYDHPASFNWKMLRKDIDDLLNKKPIAAPVYDYHEHRRIDGKIKIDSVDVIVLEGLYAFYEGDIAKHANLKIYVDTPGDERLIRRIIRDTKDRGRTLDSIISQWRTEVKPMQRLFISTQKEDADLIIPWFKLNPIAVNTVGATIKEFFKERNGE